MHLVMAPPALSATAPLIHLQKLSGIGPL